MNLPTGVIKMFQAQKSGSLVVTYLLGVEEVYTSSSVRPHHTGHTAMWRITESVCCFVYMWPLTFGIESVSLYVLMWHVWGHKYVSSGYLHLQTLRTAHTVQLFVFFHGDIQSKHVVSRRLTCRPTVCCSHETFWCLEIILKKADFWTQDVTIVQ